MKCRPENFLLLYSALPCHNEYITQRIDDILEAVDAGLIEEIPLTLEEKKAIKRQALEAKIAELEAEE